MTASRESTEQEVEAGAARLAAALGDEEATAHHREVVRGVLAVVGPLLAQIDEANARVRQLVNDVPEGGGGGALRPGDRLVLALDHRVTEESAASAVRAVDRFLPDVEVVWATGLLGHVHYRPDPS